MVPCENTWWFFEGVCCLVWSPYATVRMLRNIHVSIWSLKQLPILRHLGDESERFEKPSASNLFSVVFLRLNIKLAEPTVVMIYNNNNKPFFLWFLHPSLSPGVPSKGHSELARCSSARSMAWLARARIAGAPTPSHGISAWVLECGFVERNGKPLLSWK